MEMHHFPPLPLALFEINTRGSYLFRNTHLFVALLYFYIMFHSALWYTDIHLSVSVSLYSRFSLWVLNKPNANNTCCLYHMTHGVHPCSAPVSITSVLLTGCCHRRAGRAAAIYVVCEIRGDNNGGHCQAGVGQRQDQLACSFWGCQSLSGMSAATPQLPLSVACTLSLHPAEFIQSLSCVLSHVAQAYLRRFAGNQKVGSAGSQIWSILVQNNNNPPFFFKTETFSWNLKSSNFCCYFVWKSRITPKSAFDL